LLANWFRLQDNKVTPIGAIFAKDTIAAILFLRLFKKLYAKDMEQ